MFEDSRNCNVSTDRALVALEGVDDLVVVATQDAVLVSRQKDANGLKRLVAKLKAVAPEVTESHIKVHRPWGWYDSLGSAPPEGSALAYQVKHLGVYPGQAISLQLHHKRAEHWVIIKGTATITLGERVQAYKAGEHVHIPVGTVHRIANETDDPVEFIEVQMGSYLGEDDIVRLEDRYQRT